LRGGEVEAVNAPREGHVGGRGAAADGGVVSGASPQAEPYRVTSPVLLVTEDVTGLVVPVILLPDATLSRVTDLPGFFGIYHEHLTAVDVRRLAAEG
jgi:hypothetical protein